MITCGTIIRDASTANPTAKSVRLIGGLAVGGVVLRDLVSALQAKSPSGNVTDKGGNLWICSHFRSHSAFFLAAFRQFYL
jgi:hypothetical protein